MSQDEPCGRLKPSLLEADAGTATEVGFAIAWSVCRLDPFLDQFYGLSMGSTKELRLGWSYVIED